MKIALKREAKEKINSGSCSVQEYTLNHDTLDAASAVIVGRYPEERRVVNQLCDELVFVLEGAGKIIINHEEYTLSAGDVILIEAGDKYYWEGKMKLFLSCSPAWNKEQCKFVD